MKLFYTSNSNNYLLKNIDFDSEKEIQEFTEKNLAELFDLEIIATEFTIKQYRFDTLAFDKSTNSFVIIEYKNTKNYSVIDQGFSYLATMLENKAEFILKYQQVKQTTLTKKDINWEGSKLFFIAPAYAGYQKNAINFKDIAIELWIVQKFIDQNNNKIISYNPIKPTTTEASIKTISPNSSTINKVTAETKLYNEEDHLNKTSDEIKQLYATIKEQILALGDIDLKINKQTIAFRGNANIVDIIVYNKQLKIYLNLKSNQLQDPNNSFIDVGTKGHWGVGSYECILKSAKDININYLMSLIEQSYKKNR
jgi:predicted transport protein